MIQKQIKHLQDLKANLSEIAMQVVKDNTDVIIGFLQGNQLSLGLTSSGKVAGYYAPTTEEWARNPYNKPRTPKIAGTPYNFEWYGNFFENMYVQSEKDGYNIFSRDGKVELLEREHGQLLKLTKENNYLINKNLIEPELIKYVENNLLKM